MMSMAIAKDLAIEGNQIQTYFQLTTINNYDFSKYLEVNQVHLVTKRKHVLADRELFSRVIGLKSRATFSLNQKGTEFM